MASLFAGIVEVVDMGGAIGAIVGGIAGAAHSRRGAVTGAIAGGVIVLVLWIAVGTWIGSP